MKQLRITLVSCALAMGMALPVSAGTFDIVINFADIGAGGVNGSGLTASQATAFSSAENTWENFLPGVIDPVNLTLTIDATAPAIDGAGGILGQAGPTNGIAAVSYVYATDGTMQFDSADVAGLEAGGSWETVILHEMAHVIGFGTLWSSSGVGFPGYQEVYTSGTGQYTGVNALAAYQDEFDPLATFVPVELGGSAGTANGHWNEVDGGAGATGVVSIYNGGDMMNELMTGWLNSPTFVSNTTVASFADIGYLANLPYSAAAQVPVPASMGLLLFGLGMVARRRSAR